MIKRNTKVIIGFLIFAITIVGVYIVADMSSIKTLSRIEVTETPLYKIQLAGAIDGSNFVLGDHSTSNQMFPTKDGGWVATNHTDYYHTNLVKYDKRGNIEWSKPVGNTVTKEEVRYIYPLQPERNNNVVSDVSNPQQNSISRLAVAKDGSGYYVSNYYYNIITKYDNEGNQVWVSHNQNGYRKVTFEHVCPYAGNTNSCGEVNRYIYDGSTGEYYNDNYYVDLTPEMQIDADTYYCGFNEWEYVNTAYTFSHDLQATPDGGVVLLTYTDNKKYILSNGSEVQPGNGQSIFKYDKNGNLVNIYHLEVDGAIQQYLQKYNLPDSYGWLGSTSPSSYYYHYFGIWDNGDILYIPDHGAFAIKYKYNSSQDKYDVVYFNPFGFNGTSFSGNYNANYDGILHVTLLSNGGFTIINNTPTSYTVNNDNQYYNTEMQQFDNHPMFTCSDGHQDYTCGTTTPIQVYNAQGKYSNIIIPFGGFGKYDEIFDTYGAKNDYIYYSTSSSEGVQFLITDDGGAIVGIPVRLGANMDYWHTNDLKVILTNGEEAEIDRNATYVFYKVNSDSKIEWLKQYTGVEKFGYSNGKMILSSDKKNLIVPLVLNAGAKELGSNTDLEALYGTGKKLLVYNMLFNREEREIPDPTEPTQGNTPTSPTGGTTKKTTTKKGNKKTTTTTEEVTTEPTTEETTETTTTTTKKATTTKAAEVKGEETKKKVDVKKVITIAGIGIISLFTGGFTFYFIPFVIIPRRKRVLVAMSGGPASAVAAKKLLDKHYKVYGLFISNSSNLQAFSNAKQIANKLEIDLFEQEINDVYKNKFAQGMAEHPGEDLDKLYNKYILLEALKDVAKEQHIKYIATGHYATKKSGTIQSGVNQVFDESDKLSLLTSDDIKKLLLPIGELDYQEVTKIAEANNINLTNTKQTPEEKIGANNIPKKD